MRKILFVITLICSIFLTACSTVNVDNNFGNVVEGDNNNTEVLDTTNDTEALEESVKIEPLDTTIDINNLNDCTIAISLNEGDAYVDDTGKMQMKVTVYDYDLYDMVDISNLKVGDTIIIGENNVVVSKLERNDIGTVIINGGIDQGGYELGTNDNGVFSEIGYNDAKSYYAIGEATIRVSTEFKYIDSSNLDEEPKEYFPGDFLTEKAGIEYNFNPNNTTIVVKDGQIVEMNRVYIP